MMHDYMEFEKRNDKSYWSRNQDVVALGIIIGGLLALAIGINLMF